MKKFISVLFVAVCFLMLVTNSNAQDRKFGLKGGVTAYSITTEFGSIEASSDRKIGFEAGVFGDFPISEIFSIQAEAVFVQKGGEENDETLGVSSATLNYVDVPLLLKVSIPMEGSFRPYVFGGGYAGYLLEATSDQDGSSEDITEFVDDINYGLKLGLGAHVGNFLIDARYDMGLANLFADDDELGEIDGFKISTSGIVVTLGIAF